MGTLFSMQKPERAPAKTAQLLCHPCKSQRKACSDSIYYCFFFSLANGRDWTYLQHLRLLDSPLSYLLLSEFKGSLVGCKGLLIMLKIKVENNQVLKRTLHLKLRLSVVSINKDFYIWNTDIWIRNTGISIWIYFIWIIIKDIHISIRDSCISNKDICISKTVTRVSKMYLYLT